MRAQEYLISIQIHVYICKSRLKIEKKNDLLYNTIFNLVPRLLSTLPVPSRCERTLVMSGHVIRVRLPYEVGVGRLITFVSKCFKIVTVLFH